MVRSRLAIARLCVLCASVCVSSKPSQAADALDVSYIPADAVAAVVVHPRTVLTSPEFEMLPIEVLVASSKENLGIDPTQIEEAIGVLGMTGLPNGEPGMGAILRFAKPYDQTAVLARLGRDTEEATHAGKKYRKSLAQGGIAIFMPDDRTLLIANDSAMKGMLAPRKEETPLVRLLKQVDTSKAGVAVLDFATIRPLVATVLKGLPTVPRPLDEFVEGHEYLKWVGLTLDTKGGFSATLTLGGNDAASAGKLKDLAERAKVVGREFAETQLAEMAESADETQQAMAQYMRRVVLKLIDGIEIKLAAEEVNIVMLKDSPQAATTGVLVALLLPAVQAAREAARRNQSTNNLKQIGLSLLNYHDAKRTFPARAIADQSGKPLLSWRVAILPYLEEEKLYQEFHLDEPWDSEHNRKLIARMPSIYLNPNTGDKEKTNYLAAAGKGCFFEGTEGLPLSRIIDGTSNTVMVVEVDPDRAIIWTKPEDLEVDMDQPIAGLGNLRSGGFLALFADSHVQFINGAIDPAQLRAILTFAGREQVNPNQ